MSSKSILYISRNDFLEAARLLHKLCKPSKDEEAVISFDGACLHIELGGMAVQPGAKGTWNAQVRVPGSFILGIAKLPPVGDPIEVRLEMDQIQKNHRFHVGASSVHCHCQPVWSNLIELPIKPSIGEILSLPLRYTQTEIERAGLIEMVKNAEEWSLRKLQKVAEELGEFGVTLAQLQELVANCLRSKYCQNKITREQAIEIATKYAGGKLTVYSVTDRLPRKCGIYVVSTQGDYWYILCDWNDGETGVIRSSRLICLSQETGTVAYDGPAGDEG